MKVEHVNTWKECECKLLQFERDNSTSSGRVWFRGVSKAKWCLTATLERYRSDPFFVADYWNLMQKIKPQVESFNGLTWEVPDWCEPDSQFSDYFWKNSAIGYMAHLRHHGFPSPLLDWSRSPYIAACFAFAGVKTKPEHRGDDRVAIYAFSEMPNNIKSSTPESPTISSHGGYNLKTHARHFRQQSAYTVSVNRVQENGRSRWRFVPHQNFNSSETGKEQDSLCKITVPSSERERVLSWFDRYNLNAFSLFGSEEALMDTLAFREASKTA